MSRKFQDRNFLVWEVYPSGGRHGFSDYPQVIFHCLTRQDMRPRAASLGTDEADAQRRLGELSDAELLAMLEEAEEIT
jgi:hypothetical protein